MFPNDVKPSDRVAIAGVNSDATLFALRTLWSKGAVAVLCSTRDPQPVIDEWLYSIKAEKIPLPPFSKGEKAAGTILRTSGSAAKPKSVLHTLEQHIANAHAVVRNVELDSNSRWLLSLPLYHVGGLSIAIRCWLVNAKVVVPPIGWSLGWAIGEMGVTHISLVATQLARFMADGRNLQWLRRLKAIVLGGGPASRSLVERALIEGLPIVITYGCTEMASQTTSTSLGDGLQALLSSGRVLSDRQLKIADDGEICVKGPMLFSGYVDGENVHPTRDPDGWFHTRDLGFIDQQGYLHILGRKDNMMISGGENIHPEEIERALLDHADVEEAIVVPVADKEFGQRPAAFVKMREGQPLDSQILNVHLQTRIARFKIPKQFHAWPKDVAFNGVKVSRSGLVSWVANEAGK